MRFWTAVFVCVFLVVFATQSYAQIDSTAIPECGPQERNTLVEVLREYQRYLRGIGARSSRIELDDYGRYTDAVAELIEEMHDLQIGWRLYDESRLPHCALAVNAGADLGALLDEMLIAILLLDGDYRAPAEWHADPISELSQDLWALLDELEDKSAA